jgi:hypothetical protein
MKLLNILALAGVKFSVISIFVYLITLVAAAFLIIPILCYELLTHNH